VDSQFLGEFLGSGDSEISALDNELTDAVAVGVSMTPNDKIYAETAAALEEEQLPIETELE
jgi:hypothetical protein